INGLHVAHDKYSDSEWKSKNAFKVGCYRVLNNVPSKENLIVWDGDTAAKAHIETVNMIASYGIIDMFSLFEEFVFDFYREYKTEKPELFIKGQENKDIRKLFKDRENNPAAWEEAWIERLDKWQRKKIYEGLDRVFLGYFSITKLKKPKHYQHTTPETWAETIKGIAILRNCLVHGTTNVPKELAHISQTPHGLGFNFKEGDKIELSTHHLMSIELFADQLLTALNLSLIEHVQETMDNNC
ncbi:MAG: hypothetical protein SVR94_19010, partial [Pseudomonadota bacterium]|nr:hypothetical protein [Pseudomonadota bacterium]